MPRKNPPRETLGQVLARARAAQGLSIRQLASLIEDAPSQISRWERDEWPPSAPALLKLVRVLELSAEDMFALAGIAERPSLPAMLRREYDLPPEAIAEAQAAVEAVARKYQPTKPRPRKRTTEGR